MFIPPIKISPEETSQKRGMRLAIVDFPDPEGPTRAVTSPCRAIKEIPSALLSLSYFLYLRKQNLHF